jgi:hypothetical protein
MAAMWDGNTITRGDMALQVGHCAGLAASSMVASV